MIQVKCKHECHSRIKDNDPMISIFAIHLLCQEFATIPASHDKTTKFSA